LDGEQVMENRTNQLILSEDEEVRFEAATVYEIKQEDKLCREVGRVPIDTECPGSYVADGQRWLEVARFYDEEAWYLLDVRTPPKS